ncbi:MAG: 3'-5' exonuclease [Thermomicrobiales bacterium]|nr:3'-5' exonuclease [Thermomicrobiales bacterium]
MASTSHLPEYVALDVETTGLNPQYDDIIEVALIIFNEREEISRYSQLVKPRRALPMAISRLTGITEEMLADAPRFIDIQNELRERIGDRPIVGHNIAFDIGMLEGNGLAVTNPVIDTYTLATGLLHDAPNYPGRGRWPSSLPHRLPKRSDIGRSVIRSLPRTSSANC